MKRKNSVIIGTVALCTGALLTWYSSVSGTIEPTREQITPVVRPVPTVLVTRSSGESYRSFPGSVRATSRVELAFSIDGLLTRLNAIEGKTVTKGSVVAQLDQRDARNSYQAAEARFNIAKKDLDRSQILLDRKVVPQAEFDANKTSYDIAAAEMRIRKKGIDDTVLRAPFDGIVSKRYVENYQHIKAKDGILSLKDISLIDVVIQVPERLIANGGGNRFSEVKVLFDALPDKYYPAAIREFSIESDPVTRTYEVVVSLDPPGDLQILPGMTATVLSSTKAGKSAGGLNGDIVIPLAAVVSTIEPTSHVWVIPATGGKPVKTAVQVGPLRADGIQILSGLEPGEHIAVAGVHSLTDNMLVRPAQENREGLDQ